VGKTWHEILVLGIVHEGMAYPILWEMLEKKGNSNQTEHIDLLNRFTQFFVTQLGFGLLSSRAC